jgi:hypothetical protein
LKVYATSFEVVHVDVPFISRDNIGRGVSLRSGSPYESLVADFAREVDDDVGVVDAVGIGQILVDLREPRLR